MKQIQIRKQGDYCAEIYLLPKMHNLSKGKEMA